MTEREITKSQAQAEFDKAWDDATREGHAVRSVSLTITGDLGAEREGDPKWGISSGWTHGHIAHLAKGAKQATKQLDGMVMGVLLYGLDPLTAWTDDVVKAAAEAKKEAADV